MEKKDRNHIIKKSSFLILTVLIISICSILGGILGAKLLNNQSNIENILKKVSIAIATIEENYPLEIDSSTLIESSINNLLKELDPHSHFLNKSAYTRIKEEQKGSFYGLGFTITKLNGMLTIISPIEGTPAHRAGLKAGDVIIEINGNPTKDEPIDVSVSKLRGPKGTKVNITIIREGYQEPLHFELIRDEIPINSIPYYFMLNQNTGYIKLKSFTETTTDELNKALETLAMQNMSQLILDLRNNPGGLLDIVVNVCDIFLPKDLLLTYTKGRGKSSTEEFYSINNDLWENLPLIILVDKWSASASEILAGAIQDHDRGLIIGEPTWGKALVQSLYPLKYGTAISLTTAKYYTPSGRLIQRKYESIYSLYFGVEEEEDNNNNNNNNNNKVFYTDLGRKVYEEGGISPDIIIKEEKNVKILDDLFRKYAFFNFAKKFEAIDAKNQANSSLQKLDINFTVDEKMINAFKEFIKSEKIEFEEQEFELNKKEIAREIEREIRLSLWGAENAYKNYFQDDKIIKEALDHFQDSISLHNKMKLNLLEKK